jgi:oligopeptide/dipeptide ABC transporter ATP-binding protein
MSVQNHPHLLESGRPDSGALLDVRSLTVRYTSRGGDVTAVDGVTFAVRPGERVALVGESGSGKSGACQAVAGLLTQPNATVTAEHLTFAGVEVLTRRSGRIPARVPGLAMIFQDAAVSLDPVWTIGSQLRGVIRTTQRVRRRQADALAEDWLRRVGIADVRRVLSSRPDELSGGMRQRAMIAIALSGAPRLLIADEPTSALDAALSREVMELLVGLTAEFGTGLLLVSHDIQLCQEFADRMLVMYGGRVVEEGSSGELAAEPRHPYTQALFRSVPTLDGADLDELPTIAMSPGGQRDPDGGCNFRLRCSRAHGACREVPPSMAVGPRRSAACWLVIDADEDADTQTQRDADPAHHTMGDTNPVAVGPTGSA